MNRIFLLFVFSVLGCATAKMGEVDLLGTPQIRTVMAGARAGDGTGPATIRYVDEPIVVEEVVRAPREEVWPLLLDAYRAEGLAPDGVDPVSGIVSLSRVEWSRERDGLPLSAFLDCGLSGTGRPMADDARIVSAIISQVAARGTDATGVAIRFEAVAFPFDASGGRVRGCTTTGELERAIVARIQAALSPRQAESEFRGTEVWTQPALSTPPVRAEVSDLPIEPGDQVRVWLSSSERLTGAFMGVQPDTLFLRRSRRTALPLRSIEAIQIKRIHRPTTVFGFFLGMAAGVTLALTTDLGIGGGHAIQGKLLNPGLGALVGGLAGAAVGTVFFATSWEDVPLEMVRPDAYLPGWRQKPP